jgi:hypothetical protein
MHQYGLPYPNFLQSELQRYWEKHEPEKEKILYRELESQSPMTQEQKDFFDGIIETLDNTNSHDNVSLRLLLASAGNNVF